MYASVLLVSPQTEVPVPPSSHAEKCKLVNFTLLFHQLCAESDHAALLQKADISYQLASRFVQGHMQYRSQAVPGGPKRYSSML